MWLHSHRHTLGIDKLLNSTSVLAKTPVEQQRHQLVMSTSPSGQTGLLSSFLFFLTLTHSDILRCRKEITAVFLGFTLDFGVRRTELHRPTNPNAICGGAALRQPRGCVSAPTNESTQSRN